MDRLLYFDDVLFLEIEEVLGTVDDWQHIAEMDDGE